MKVNVTDYLKERKYKAEDTEGGLSVTDASGKSHNIDTTAFTKGEDGFYADAKDIQNSLTKSSVGAPTGYVPLRNTLAAAGVNVGYAEKSDAPIVNGQLLNPSDSRLVKVGDTYYMDAAYAQNFMPKKYENPYEKKTKEVLSSLINDRFQYNPLEDDALLAAQKSAMLAAKQSANSRGLLGGTTAEIMRQRAAQELVPTYAQMAYEKFQDGRNSKLQTLSVLDALSDQAFREYETQNNIALATQKQATGIEEAWNKGMLAEREQTLAEQKAKEDADANTFMEALKKVQLMGEVDDTSAQVLGLPKGMLTAERRQFLEAFAQAMEKLAASHNYKMAEKAAS